MKKLNAYDKNFFLCDDPRLQDFLRRGGLPL
jgi:hypothetical protein